jgi:hypothetical protein
MSSFRDMRFPAGQTAEVERQARTVAGRYTTRVVLLLESDGILARGAFPKVRVVV